MDIIIRGLILFIQGLSLLIILHFAMAWMLRSDNPATRFTGRLLAPLLDPVRRILSRLPVRLPVDLSPLVAVLLLQPVRSLLLWILWRIL